MRNLEKGQTIIILLLIVVVALGIGLAVVGRSITEISTSTKTEESTRAFSAAEAGVEKALIQSSGNIGIGTSGSFSPAQIPLSNQAQAQVNWNPSLPEADCGSGRACALEYPPFGKESFAQFWLASPINTAGDFPQREYSQSSFDLYFGSINTTVNGVYIDDPYYTSHPSDLPAVEVNVIYRDGNEYGSIRKFYDSAGSRGGSTTFDPCDERPPLDVKTNQKTNPGHAFYCKVNVGGYPVGGNQYPVMVRVRIINTNISHPVALQPLGNCGSSCALPPQVAVINSTGSAGSTQRTIQVFQQKSVMPSLFDYVLFSAGTLNK